MSEPRNEISDQELAAAKRGAQVYLAIALRRLSEDPEALTAAHLALEDELIELRDAGLSVMGPANGLVVRYTDGTPSDAIRIPTRDAVRMALTALADHLTETETGETTE